MVNDEWMIRASQGNRGRSGMLILTRRVGEKLRIGDDISVTILGVKGTQVRIGVHAPENVAVHREEIYERIQAQQDRHAAPRVEAL